MKGHKRSLPLDRAEGVLHGDMAARAMRSHGEASASPVCSIRKHGTISNEFTTTDNMVNSSFKNIQTAEMIVELQARGIDMTSAIEQMQAERKLSKSKVIPFPKSHGAC